MRLEKIPVLILAGGKGTRLQGVVSDRPKPMADIAGHPFLDILINKYKQHDIWLSVGYMKDYIKNHYKDSVKYVEEGYSLGTGGAIRLAFEEINSEYLIVLNGDTFADVVLEDPTSLINMNLVYQDDCSRYGYVEEIEEGQIKFKEKGHNSSGYINSGVYILHKAVFKDLPEQFSFETYLERYKDFVTVKRNNVHFIDIGVPEDYEKAQNELKHLIP